MNPTAMRVILLISAITTALRVFGTIVGEYGGSMVLDSLVSVTAAIALLFVIAAMTLRPWWVKALVASMVINAVSMVYQVALEAIGSVDYAWPSVALLPDLLLVFVPSVLALILYKTTGVQLPPAD
ncbi:MAG: hypothetical protein WCI74_00605 [Actinomycetes bacterium]